MSVCRDVFNSSPCGRRQRLLPARRRADLLLPGADRTARRLLSSARERQRGRVPKTGTLDIRGGERRMKAEAIQNGDVHCMWNTVELKLTTIWSSEEDDTLLSSK